MRCPCVIGVVSVALLAVSADVGLLAQQAASKSSGTTQAAAAAAKASPELVGSLAKELGSTPEQAAGAAGALFGVAKSRLNADEFRQVSKAVPGMDALLRAAPAVETGGVGGALSKATGTTSGSAAGLATAASAFSQLGLKPDMVSKAVPVLTSFVSKSGGANVGSLLAGALK